MTLSTKALGINLIYIFWQDDANAATVGLPRVQLDITNQAKVYKRIGGFNTLIIRHAVTGSMLQQLKCNKCL